MLSSLFETLQKRNERKDARGRWAPKDGAAEPAGGAFSPEEIARAKKALKALPEPDPDFELEDQHGAETYADMVQPPLPFNYHEAQEIADSVSGDVDKLPTTLRRVPVGDLRASQPAILKKVTLKYLREGTNPGGDIKDDNGVPAPYPMGVRGPRGQILLIDGHHRVSAHVLAGRTHVEVMVIE